MIDDHDAWLASLAGRGESKDKESAMLRRIMLEAEQREAGQPDQDSLDHDWQRLRFALRREARSERPAWLGWPVFAQAAMLLAVVGGVALMSLPEQTPGPALDGGDGVVMRGRFTQELAVAEPATAAVQMAERLRVLGVAVELKHQPELSELRVRLAHPVAAAVNALFAEAQIELPRQGDLYVLFVPVTH
jgi:hypothetical protein